MNDKEMLEKSAEIPTGETPLSNSVEESDKSKITDSQLNIDASRSPAEEGEKPAVAKKTRKPSTKTKSKKAEAPVEAENEDTLADSATVEVKKKRKRTTQPKTVNDKLSEDTEKAPAEFKKPRRKSSKPKTEEATVTEADTDKLPTVELKTEESEALIITDVFSDFSIVIPKLDGEAPSEAEATGDESEAEEISDSQHGSSSSESENDTEETTQETAGEDEDQLIIPLFPSSTYVTEENGEKSEKTEDEEENGETIIPPDEIFSVRFNDFVDLTDSSSLTRETDAEDTEAPVNDEGQYIIPELNEREEEDNKKYVEEDKPEKYDPKKPRKIDGRFDLAELIVFTLLAVMIITSFFFRHSVVQGDSMMNTLQNGEHLIISDFFYTPQRGDIIVCQDYTAKLNTPIVKRVIAVGGDTIRITKTEIYVNGEPENDYYVFIDPYAMPYFYEPMEEMTIPEGEIFVMGDHRNNSKDSRDQEDLGTISEDAVLGKVLLRFYPFDKFGPVK